MKTNFHLTGLLFLVLAPGVSADDRAALAIFEQRILPIFRSPEPSSCVQCHLAAVDLKDYILPSSDATFASLREQGLIDLDRPGDSKILKLINMGEADYDQGAKMIHARNRRAEHDAFAAWIRAGARDPRLRQLPAPSRKAGPHKPDAVIRHARADRVLDSFTRNIWSQRMRCFPCHTPYEIDPVDAKHQVARERMKKMEQDLGDLFTTRMRIFRETPAETLNYLIRDSRRQREDRLPLLNLKAPNQSLLVLKPMSRLPEKKASGGIHPPSHVAPVSHLGGLKMHPDDFSYKAFVSWIEDYARVLGNAYQTLDELPRDNWYFTRHLMLMREAPAGWPGAARVQFTVHAPGSGGKGWTAEPVAFTQGTVTPRRTVFGTLILLRGKSSEAVAQWNEEPPTLPAGRYLIKAFVDRDKVLQKTPSALLGPEAFAGQSILSTHWGDTLKTAVRFSGETLTMPTSAR